MIAENLPHNPQYLAFQPIRVGSADCADDSERVRSVYAELRALGVRLSIDGDGRLAFDGPAGVMTADRLARLRADRDALIALVERFEERAAVVEHDGRLSRADAERLAFDETIESVLKLQTVVQKTAIQPDSVIEPEPVMMPDGVSCPFCPARMLLDDSRGSRCSGCGRLAWLTLPNGSIVRADFVNVVLHPFPY